MLWRIKDWASDFLYDHDGAVYGLFVILILVLVFGSIFGIYCFLGMILQFIYNAIRPSINGPELNYWVFVGIAFILNCFKATVKVINKKE